MPELHATSGNAAANPFLAFGPPNAWMRGLSGDPVILQGPLGSFVTAAQRAQYDRTSGMAAFAQPPAAMSSGFAGWEPADGEPEADEPPAFRF